MNLTNQPDVGKALLIDFYGWPNSWYLATHVPEGLNFELAFAAVNAFTCVDTGDEPDAVDDATLATVMAEKPTPNNCRLVERTKAGALVARNAWETGDATVRHQHDALLVWVDTAFVLLDGLDPSEEELTIEGQCSIDDVVGGPFARWAEHALRLEAGTLGDMKLYFLSPT